MRKVLIIALGLAGLGGFFTAQPASATKKRVCQTSYGTSSTLGWKSQCGPHSDWRQNNCQVRVNNAVGIQYCYDIDVLIPTGTAAQMGSASGMIKSFDHNNRTHAN
jgi:hypothetical protein